MKFYCKKLLELSPVEVLEKLAFHSHFFFFSFSDQSLSAKRPQKICKYITTLCKLMSKKCAICFQFTASVLVAWFPLPMKDSSLQWNDLDPRLTPLAS